MISQRYMDASVSLSCFLFWSSHIMHSTTALDTLISHFLQIPGSQCIETGTVHKNDGLEPEFPVGIQLSLWLCIQLRYLCGGRKNSPQTTREQERYLGISYTLLCFQYPFLISLKWNLVVSWIAQVLKFNNDAQYALFRLFCSFE